MNQLPQAIAGYVEAANAQAPADIAACFDIDATVMDEGALRRGRDEIEAWARASSVRYGSVIEPVSLEEAGGRHRMLATVSGRFPGSPIALHFDFQLVSSHIQSLEITP